jgi:hypothetical protein
MSRIVRFAVLVASLMSLFAVMSSTAGAVTWDNSGNTHFTATAGAGTLSSTGVALNCASADATGKTTTPAVGATAALVHATINFTTCLLSGQAVGVECGVTLTATSQSGSVTSGSADATCGVYLAGIKVCHIEGSVNGTYTNPSGATAGVLQTTTGGNLRTTNAQSNCALGNNEPTHLSVLTFRVTNGTGGTGTLGPIITRTA